MPVVWVWILAVLLLVSSGITYRVLASRLKLVVDTPVELPVPLSAFPKKIGQWIGKDVQIPQNIQNVAGYDAFLSGNLTEYSLPDEELEKFKASFSDLPEAKERKTGKW